MKIGDYVRTKSGEICKLDYYDEKEERWITYNNVFETEVKISSPNIIDLIERFDLVNGHLVICKMYENEKNIPTIVKCVGDYYFKEEDIKSIVTKEQFERCEYKI